MKANVNGLEIKSVKEQIKIFNSIFDFKITEKNCMSSLPQLPKEADGWFVLLNDDRAFEKLNTASFSGEKKASLTMFKRTSDALNEIEIKISPYVIIPCQLGKKYKKGTSLEEAHELFDSNEFGLNTNMIASLILTHPKIFHSLSGIVCTGEKYISEKDGGFVHTPTFHRNSELIYSSERISIGRYRIATGFLQKNIFASYEFFDHESYEE